MVHLLQCARSQLGEKATCPTCWKETTISGFRVNPAMEEAVTAWKEARHVPMHCAMTAHRLFDVLRLFGRRFVLRVVNEALNAQIAASESSRPYKRRKPNSHSGNVVTSGDEAEQAMRTGSEPPTSKVVTQSTGCHRLTSTVV